MSLLELQSAVSLANAKRKMYRKPFLKNLVILITDEH